MGTKIIKCTCKNAWMDKTYGKGMRVYNTYKAKSGKNTSGRCTVCTKEIWDV